MTLSGQGHCLRMVLDKTYQLSGKQSKFRDITVSRDDSSMRSKAVTLSEKFSLNKIKEMFGFIFYPDETIQ